MNRLPIDKLKAETVKELIKAEPPKNNLTEITLLKSEQVAELLSIEIETLHLWVRQNRFPSPDIRNKRFSRWQYQTIKNWIDKKSKKTIK